MSEGERCEVIGFIKSGECLLRRYINVAHTFPNGRKVSACLFINFELNPESHRKLFNYSLRFIQEAVDVLTIPT